MLRVRPCSRVSSVSVLQPRVSLSLPLLPASLTITRIRHRLPLLCRPARGGHPHHLRRDYGGSSAPAPTTPTATSTSTSSTGRRALPYLSMPTPPGHWLWGSLPAVWELRPGSNTTRRNRGHLFYHWMELAKLYSPMMRTRLFGEEYVMVFDPELCKEAMAANHAERYSRGPKMLIRTMSEPAPMNLFVLEGATWKKHRKLATPAFSMKSLREIVPMFQKDATAMVNAIDTLVKQENKINIQTLITNCTLDVIGRAGFGLEFGVQQQMVAKATGQPSKSSVGDITDAIKIILDEFMLRSLNPLRALNPLTVFNFKDAIKKMRAVLFKTVKEKRATTKLADHDILALYLKANEDGDVLSDEECVDETVVFLLAGHETSATALTWAVYMLSQHPDTLLKIQAEVDSVFGSSSTLDMDSVKQLVYTEQVIWETLRLYPPAASVARKATVEHELGGYTIPVGANVVAPFFVLQNSPKYWDNPQFFKPDRMHPDLKATYHPSLLMPFGKGPRACIGQYFAMLEMKVILATLVRNFTFALHGGRPVPKRPVAYPLQGPEILYGLTPRIKDGPVMSLQRRTPSATTPAASA